MSRAPWTVCGLQRIDAISVFFSGPSQDATAWLAELRHRRDQIQDSIRAVLSLGNQNGFMADELKRLNELNSLDRSIELASVTNALQRIDPIWEILHPDEQRRVLELLVETITVSKADIEVRFRTNGIEQVVEELEPMGVGSDE